MSYSSARHTDIRRAARAAAEEAGLSLEEWIETVFEDGEAAPQRPATDDQTAMRLLANRLDSIETMLDSRGNDEPASDQPAMQELEALLSGRNGDTKEGANQLARILGEDLPITRNAASDALREIGKRLDTLAGNMAAARKSNAPPNEGIQRLETRLDTIAAKLDEAGDKDGEAPSEVDNIIANHTQRLEQKLDAMSQRMAESAKQAPVARMTPPAITKREAEMVRRINGIDEAVSQIVRRQREIDSEQQTSRKDSARQSTVEMLKREIQRLASKLDATSTQIGTEVGTHIEKRLGALTAQLDTATRTELDGIRSEINSLANRFEEGTQAGFSAMRSALADFAKLHKAPDISKMENRLAEIADGVAYAARNGESIADAIGDRFDALTKRIDKIAADGSMSAAGLKTIETQLATVARYLGDTVSVGPQALQAIEDKVTALARQVDEAAAAQPQALRTIEDKLAALAGQVNEAAQVKPQALQTIATHFDQMNARLDALTQKSAESSASDAFAADAFSTLESRINDLARRLEDIADKPNDQNPEAIAQLGERVAQLAELVEAAERNRPEMPQIDQAMGDLARRVDDVRDSAMDAARNAAEQALQAISAAGGSESELADGLQQELNALRIASDDASRRTEETLSIMRDVLGTIVDRITDLETPQAISSIDDPLLEPEPAPIDFGAGDTPMQAADSLAPIAADDVLAPMPDETAQTAMPQTVMPDEDDILVKPEEDHVLAEPVGLDDLSPTAAQALVEPVSDLDVDAVPAGGTDADAVEFIEQFAPQAYDLPVEQQAASIEPQAASLDTPLPPEPMAPPQQQMGATIVDEVDDHMPLPPGSATPMPTAEAAPADADQPQQARNERSDFIAAARRAAQRAAADEATTGLVPDKDSPEADGPLGRARKPLVMMSAALIVVVGSLKLYGMIAGGSAPEADAPAVSSDANAPGTTVIPGDAEPIAAIDGDAAPVADAPAAGDDIPAAPVSPVDTAPVDAPADGPVSDAGASAEDADAMTTSAVTPRVIDLTTPPNADAQSYETDAAPQATGAAPGQLPDAIGPGPLRQAAIEGDSSAQFEIGSRFAQGRGVPQDLKAAADWYQRAAAQGLAPAQYRLGTLFEKGHGVTRDAAMAQMWYLRAADQGNRKAMHNLAVLSAQGLDGEPDFPEAARWFRQAAEHGLRDSQFNLGILSARGLGIDVDLTDAYKWFAIAAAGGDKEAGSKRDQIASGMDATELAAAKQIARAWEPTPLIESANFVRPSASWEDASLDEALDPKVVVRAAQTMLNELGFSAGPADGIMGPRTRDAIKAFQTDNGMIPTGIATPDLLTALQRVTG